MYLSDGLGVPWSRISSVPFCGGWVIVSVSSSPSASKHGTRLPGSPTSTRACCKPKHWGGSATAGRLLVVTVTSFESELPSLALNLKLSAPSELARYHTDGTAASPG